MPTNSVSTWCDMQSHERHVRSGLVCDDLDDLVVRDELTCKKLESCYEEAEISDTYRVDP